MKRLWRACMVDDYVSLVTETETGPLLNCDNQTARKLLLVWSTAACSYEVRLYALPIIPLADNDFFCQFFCIIKQPAMARILKSGAKFKILSLAFLLEHFILLRQKTRWTILNELDNGGSLDRKRGWVCQTGESMYNLCYLHRTLHS